MNIKRNQIPASVWRNPLHFLAFGCGSGAAPYAPGTFGTLLAVGIYLLIQQLPLETYAALVLVLFAAGVWICDKTSRDINTHDHPGIVWDEIVGFLITMFAAPAQWYWLVAGFCLFRLFDIWKPFPIRLLDRHVSGGLGIMLDDVLAGIYAGAILQAVAYAVA